MVSPTPVVEMVMSSPAVMLIVPSVEMTARLTLSTNEVLPNT